MLLHMLMVPLAPITDEHAEHRDHDQGSENQGQQHAGER